MTPWCDVLVCSWRRLLADRHSLPFPWTLSLHRRWCPSASHHPLTFLSLPALTFPLPSPFPSLGLSIRGPWCPSASPHSFPSLSLGRLCQRSPRTCPVSLLCVESTQSGGGGGGLGAVSGARRRSTNKTCVSASLIWAPILISASSSIPLRTRRMAVSCPNVRPSSTFSNVRTLRVGTPVHDVMTSPT